MSAGCSDSEPAASSSPGKPATTGTSAGGVNVEFNYMNSLVPSTYVQLDDLKLNFIEFNVINPTGSTKTVIVESEVPGFTEKAVNTIDVPARGNVTIGQAPSLRVSAIPTEMTPATLHVKVSLADGTRIDEQTVPIKIYAKDTMVWQVFDGEQWNDMSPYIGAWVTPHAAGIDPLVRKAAEYHPQKSINGYQCGDSCTDAMWQEDTNEQVKAIFTALKNDYRITYINSPIAFAKQSDNPQRVRLPAESLTSKSANCIDGTVLYASALESIGMTPHLILIPGHAFVCYETKQNSPNSLSCLETTMTGTSTFEEAVQEGNQKYLTEINNGDFNSGASQDLSVAVLRKEGISPMQ
ncbi:hypothetical protein [uncultured Methanoregula sp.]|uniref:hypothetical protein n=1 Tax=uncultured Methanoregula sp. TaxID=1005933 RepID=UPI00374972A4